MMKLRNLKRTLKIGAADFHHIAASIKEKREIFVTVDERHLLKAETKQALQKYINILNPGEALHKLKKDRSARS
jgi:hypothetical protein